MADPCRTPPESHFSLLSFQKSDFVSAAKAYPRHIAAIASPLFNYWSRDIVCIPLANERSVELHSSALSGNKKILFSHLKNEANDGERNPDRSLLCLLLAIEE